MKNLSFSRLFWTWFAICMVLNFINGWFFKISLLHSIYTASIGVFLLIHPLWPKNLSYYWSEKKCRTFIRIIAAVQIALSFMTRMNF